MVKQNAKTYCEQIFKVIDMNKTTIRFNSEWLAKLSFEEVIQLAATTSVARLLEREDFQKRYRQQIPIGIHEFFYPLMQAYDSVELQADIELGGTDQTFNILMGRTLQKQRRLEKQIAIFMPLLEGLDGIEKMSKSLGNYIGVSEAPEVMFKKVMEVPDALLIKYFELATDGTTAMEEAKSYFQAAFQRKEIPKNIPILLLEIDKERIVDIIPQLVAMDYIHSKSEFLRLIKQNGVSLNGEKIVMDDLSLVLMNDDVIQIGKKRFLKLNK